MQRDPILTAAWLGLGSVTVIEYLMYYYRMCLSDLMLRWYESKPAGIKLFRSMETCIIQYMSFKNWCWTVFHQEQEYNILREKSRYGYFPRVTGNKASFAICVWSVSPYLLVLAGRIPLIYIQTGHTCDACVSSLYIINVGL